MGAGADRWWNDRVGAAVRLTQRLALWCRDHPGDEVIVVYDGAPQERVSILAGGNLRVLFATRSGRDAADDRIVELVDDLFVDPELTVVTSDRGLVRRLPPGVEIIGAGAFLRRIC